MASRPTSPHLGIYRWQITNTLSILHRITGFGLGLGSLILVYWLWAAAFSPECFLSFYKLAMHPISQLFLWGWVAAFYYHLANGIRHLFWDMGKGFELHDLTRSGIVVVIFTLAMTAATAYFVYGGAL